MRAPGLRSALFWTGLVVTAVFTYLAVRTVDFDEVWKALRETSYWWLLPSLAVLALAVFMRALRWRYLFAAETRPSVRSVTSALLIGYLFNNILPARAGEAARIVALHQRAGTSRAETLATVVIERAYDVLSLLVLLFVALPWLPEVTWIRAAAVLAIVLGVALAAAIVVLAVYGDRALSFLVRPLARLPLLPRERVERAALNLAHGFAGLRRLRLGVAALLWTTASWLVMAISFWLVARGFDLDLSPVAGLLVVIAIGLAMILPSSPGAIGVFEAATLVALGAYGVSESRALSYALVLHALNFLPYVAVGLLVVHFHGLSLRRRARAPRAGVPA